MVSQLEVLLEVRWLVAHAADVATAVLEHVGCGVCCLDSSRHRSHLRVSRVRGVYAIGPHVLYLGKQSIVAEVENFVICHGYILLVCLSSHSSLIVQLQCLYVIYLFGEIIDDDLTALITQV